MPNSILKNYSQYVFMPNSILKNYSQVLNLDIFTSCQILF